MNKRLFTYENVRRVADVAGAGALLLVTAPAMAVISGLLHLEGTRPALFTQKRIGKDGEPFTIYKFRSLNPHAENNTPHRERATPVGRWLRRFALDELPQLWNVLKGDMGLIGPRPTIPEQVNRYGPFERTRLDVKPGLTGWAQIHGRNALTWPERIELDVWYVHNRSPRVDLQIAVRTPLTLWRGTGTYGPGGTNPDFRASSCSQYESST